MTGGPEEVLPAAEVARLFHVGVRTIARWESEHGFPRPFHIGTRPFYRAWEVRAWQEKQMRAPAPEPGPRRDRPG